MCLGGVDGFQIDSSEHFHSESTVENLRQLTFDQILADTANLVTKVQSDLDAQHARVVVWGSRFSATVAALARKKFPHLIHGVWSSSGIFRTASVDTSFYNAVSWNLFWTGSDECASRVSEAFAEVQQAISVRNASRLQNLFNTCAPVDFSNSQQIAFFWDKLFNYVSSYIDARQ